MAGHKKHYLSYQRSDHHRDRELCRACYSHGLPPHAPPSAMSG